jgi:hypothetical protein
VSLVQLFFYVVLAAFESSIALVVGVFDVNQAFKDILNIVFSNSFNLKALFQAIPHGLYL